MYADFWWNKPSTNEQGETKYKIELKQVELETWTLTVHFIENVDLWRDGNLLINHIVSKEIKIFTAPIYSVPIIIQV